MSSADKTKLDSVNISNYVTLNEDQTIVADKTFDKTLITCYNNSNLGSSSSYGNSALAIVNPDNKSLFSDLTYNGFRVSNGSTEAIYRVNGVDLGGKTSSDLLHAKNGTISIDEIAAQVISKVESITTTDINALFS